MTVQALSDMLQSVAHEGYADREIRVRAPDGTEIPSEDIGIVYGGPGAVEIDLMEEER